MTPPAAEPGTVYLLHFHRPYRHAGHYCGWTTDLPGRLAQHAAGRGARLLAVTHAAGIGWTLARTWPGPRARERQLKRKAAPPASAPPAAATPAAPHHYRHPPQPTGRPCRDRTPPPPDTEPHR